MGVPSILAVFLVIVLDGMIGLIEWYGAGSELFCAPGQPQDRIGQHVVKSLLHIKFQNFCHFLLGIVSKVIDLHIFS